MAHLSLNIGGMSCDGCKKNIEAGLAELAGVISAIVLLEQSSAEIDYNAEVTTPAAIKETIELRGYDIK
ncbi:MAG: cation transporter [Streptococcaceae bacterium]|jgi:copper chaperone|nr:cation transporter [Streptococcaceae bacterium]